MQAWRGRAAGRRRGASSPRCTRMGTTRMLRAKAVSISRRTKSLGSSIRRFPAALVMVSHRSPINASSTSPGPTASAITSSEIVSRFDGVDVLEDVADPEAFSEPIVKPASRVGSILPPVAHEDPARRCPARPRHDDTSQLATLFTTSSLSRDGEWRGRRLDHNCTGNAGGKRGVQPTLTCAIRASALMLSAAA